MTVDADKFSEIAASLRQYRRAELSDFEDSIDAANAIDALYVDPLPSDAVLKTMLQNNTTFLVGRKGTGKSTVFAKAQFELRKKTDVISVYVDVKSLHEVVTLPAIALEDGTEILHSVFKAHQLKKAFLARVLSELINELNKAYDNQSLIRRWALKGRKYSDVINDLKKLAAEVREGKLTSEEIPILQAISSKSKKAQQQTGAKKRTMAAGAKVDPVSKSAIPTASIKVDGGIEKFDESIADSELYQEYADIVLRSFPFQEILDRIKELLIGVQLKRLFVFFDDFSELSWIEQKLFVDVVLSPLNNSSDEAVKLKVAGYPGRIYYGKIDPSKVDTISLDFYQIYKSGDIQTSEASAVEYLRRLITTRFIAFKEDVVDYFDPTIQMEDYYRLLFEVTLNVPRLLGYILHNCYLDKVSRGQLITTGAIKLAAQKYYDLVTLKYFDRMNRYAMEPFERKLDRHNQEKLLKHIVGEAKHVQRGIGANKIGGKYFEGLTNPPTSHFTISTNMEDILASLELNFMVSKYHEMRNKDGQDVSVYALSYGLCEDQKMSWGYPKGRRDDRSYFVQRCFGFNSTIKQFLSESKTIRCNNCGASFGMEKQETIEFYGWKCPDCQNGTCRVVVLGDDFAAEVGLLDQATMLPSVELEILETLNEEGKPMRAKEIAALIDTTYQMVGRRTGKLEETGLVTKASIDNSTHSSITAKAGSAYFK